MARGKSGPGGAVCAGYAKAVATFAGTRREWGGAAPFSASRRACQTALEGQTAPQAPFLRDTPKSGAPTLKRLRPAGANSVEYAHPQRPLPPRGKAASFPPSARQSRPLPHSDQSAPQRARPLLMGWARVSAKTKTPETGTAAGSFPAASCLAPCIALVPEKRPWRRGRAAPGRAGCHRWRLGSEAGPLGRKGKGSPRQR